MLSPQKIEELKICCNLMGLFAPILYMPMKKSK